MAHPTSSGSRAYPSPPDGCVLGSSSYYSLLMCDGLSRLQDPQPPPLRDNDHSHTIVTSRTSTRTPKRSSRTHPRTEIDRTDEARNPLRDTSIRARLTSVRRVPYRTAALNRKMKYADAFRVTKDLLFNCLSSYAYLALCTDTKDFNPIDPLARTKIRAHLAGTDSDRSDACPSRNVHPTRHTH
jgi:hypothetical protein